MKKSHEKESWREVMKRSHEEESWREAMIKKHEDYLIESHDRKS